MLEAASPPTHEAVSADATTLSGPTISTSSPRPQGVAAAASTDADNDIVGEPEVILGHPPLMAPGNVSLDEAMGTAR
jgi:hypothetical protein